MDAAICKRETTGLAAPNVAGSAASRRARRVAP
jgi:hypothetical protein